MVTISRGFVWGIRVAVMALGDLTAVNRARNFGPETTEGTGIHGLTRGR